MVNYLSACETTESDNKCHIVLAVNVLKMIM